MKWSWQQWLVSTSGHIKYSGWEAVAFPYIMNTTSNLRKAIRLTLILKKTQNIPARVILLPRRNRKAVSTVSQSLRDSLHPVIAAAVAGFTVSKHLMIPSAYVCAKPGEAIRQMPEKTRQLIFEHTEVE